MVPLLNHALCDTIRIRHLHLRVSYTSGEDMSGELKAAVHCLIEFQQCVFVLLYF